MDHRRTAISKDNEIFDEMYDLFRGLLSECLNFNPAGEVFYSHKKTKLLLITNYDSICVQRNHFFQADSLVRFRVLVINCQINTGTHKTWVAHVLYITLKTFTEIFCEIKENNLAAQRRHV